MRLTTDQLKSCARGCAKVLEEPEGVHFQRMPDALLSHYEKGEKLFLRCRCPAGVRLRFRSDTRSIHAELRYDRTARLIYGTDVFVDGTLRGVYGPKEQADHWAGKIFAAPTREMREFDIWLPYAVETWLTALDLDDGASFDPVLAAKMAWLALGDSITQGMTVPGPSRTYVAQTALMLGCEMHNLGVGSARMEPEAGKGGAALDWDIATVAYSVNDWHKGVKTLDEFAEDARGLLKNLLREKPGRPVGLMTPLPYAPYEIANGRGDTLEQYREALRCVAREFPSVTLLGGPSLMSAEPDRCTDGCHPNEKGMAEIARNLSKRLAMICG